MMRGESPAAEVTLADIRAAAALIAGRADATPLVPSPFFSQIAGEDVLLKLEIAQPIGAFKLRGALNAVMRLAEGAKGVTCCSTGNHGRGVAWAARSRGLRAVICMSELVPQAKRDGIAALGAEIRICGRSQDAAQEEAARLVATEGLVDIPPFDDARVIAGQGTIGLELIEARPDLDTILVPLSGGGLASGVALAAKALSADVKVIGISMEAGAAMHAALAAGHMVEVEEVESLADSLGGGIGAHNRLTFGMCRQLLDATILVSEEEIRDAMQALYYEDRLVAEGASVVGLAALMAGKLRPAGPVATILTGRNPDMAMFTQAMIGEDVPLGGRMLKGKRYGA